MATLRLLDARRPRPTSLRRRRSPPRRTKALLPTREDPSVRAAVAGELRGSTRPAQGPRRPHGGRVANFGRRRWNAKRHRSACRRGRRLPLVLPPRPPDGSVVVGLAYGDAGRPRPPHASRLAANPPGPAPRARRGRRVGRTGDIPAAGPDAADDAVLHGHRPAGGRSRGAPRGCAALPAQRHVAVPD